MELNGHVPERRCIACRRSFPQSELIRIVSTPDGLKPWGKGMSGRSCYICRNEKCVETAFEKNCFARSLRKEVRKNELAELRKRIDITD
jgi:predicted RNA-binding protein YlxR (DUF448 family)